MESKDNFQFSDSTVCSFQTNRFFQFTLYQFCIVVNTFSLMTYINAPTSSKSSCILLSSNLSFSSVIALNYVPTFYVAEHTILDAPTCRIILT